MLNAADGVSVFVLVFMLPLHTPNCRFHVYHLGQVVGVCLIDFLLLDYNNKVGVRWGLVVTIVQSDQYYNNTDFLKKVWAWDYFEAKERFGD